MSSLPERIRLPMFTHLILTLVKRMTPTQRFTLFSHSVRLLTCYLLLCGKIGTTGRTTASFLALGRKTTITFAAEVRHTGTESVMQTAITNGERESDCRGQGSVNGSWTPSHLPMLPQR
jgi:hypothetical protein